jgi:hypothetical protein
MDALTGREDGGTRRRGGNLAKQRPAPRCRPLCAQRVRYGTCLPPARCAPGSADQGVGSHLARARSNRRPKGARARRGSMPCRGRFAQGGTDFGRRSPRTGSDRARSRALTPSETVSSTSAPGEDLVPDPHPLAGLLHIKTVNSTSTPGIHQRPRAQGEMSPARRRTSGCRGRSGGGESPTPTRSTVRTTQAQTHARALGLSAAALARRRAGSIPRSASGGMEGKCSLPAPGGQQLLSIKLKSINDSPKRSGCLEAMGAGREGSTGGASTEAGSGSCPCSMRPTPAGRALAPRRLASTALAVRMGRPPGHDGLVG